MNLLQFIGANLGRRVAAPGGLGGECVDLCELWMLATHAARTWANAKDLLSMAPRAEWSIVANAPTNYPLPGDIVVWGHNASAGIGIDGHCAIAIAADADTMLVLEQNWPPGVSTRVGLHGYVGVLGWMHRKG